MVETRHYEHGLSRLNAAKRIIERIETTPHPSYAEVMISRSF
jgi:hypothetical protein